MKDMLREESKYPLANAVNCTKWGARFWAQMILHSRNLARIIWIHADEREGQVGKEDVLKKL